MLKLKKKTFDLKFLSDLFIIQSLEKVFNLSWFRKILWARISHDFRLLIHVLKHFTSNRLSNCSSFYFIPNELRFFHKHNFTFICHPRGRIPPRCNKICFIGYARITEVIFFCEKETGKGRRNQRIYAYSYFLDFVSGKVVSGSF